MSTTEPVQLIVGLANPGPQYQATRHNAGAWFIESLLDHFSGDIRPETKFHGLAGEIRVGTKPIKLLVPTTFMNKSGLAVAAMAKFYKIPAHSILVAHDELDFEPGIVRLKQGGGHGGHNGLRDVSAHLGKDYWRLRIGIGHPGHRDQVSPYVLSAPSKSDAEAILTSISDAVPMLPQLVAGEWQQAMHALHS